MWMGGKFFVCMSVLLSYGILTLGGDVGRHKTYDRQTISERAMLLFWERGYHATSTRDLTDAMGVNPCSLYAEFGSKEDLYNAAIVHYEMTVVPKYFGALEAPDASLDQIVAVLNFFGDVGCYEGAHLGCFLCNAGIERAPTPVQSQISTDRFVLRLVKAFRHALENAQAGGLLVDHAPVEALSQFFPTVLMGIFALARAKTDGVVMRAAADQALGRLAAVRR